jgi:four helix bundle protein
MQDFRKLKVWQSAYAFALEIYRLTSKFPDHEKFGLISQMRRASVSIPANIAEGCGRHGNVELARFIHIAFGSACELECHLLIAKDLGFVSVDQHAASEEILFSIKRMLSGLRKKLITDN